VKVTFTNEQLKMNNEGINLHIIQKAVIQPNVPAIQDTPPLSASKETAADLFLVGMERDL